MAQSNPHATVSPYVVGTAVNGLVAVDFRVQCQATTSDPDFVIPAGAVTAATAVDATTGQYTLTLANPLKYADLVCGHVTILAADSETAGLQAHIVSYVAATGVLTIMVKDTSADPAGAYVANNDWICVSLKLALNLADVTATAI